MTTHSTTEQRHGVINALCAYTLWGIAPIYFKLIDMVPSDEILVHRIVWSSLFLFVVVAITRRWRAFILLVKDRKILSRLLLSASFLAVNWFLFIWAVNNDYLLDASLGYFINPLFSVALGMLFLGEKLRKWQKISVILAFVGVFIQLLMIGKLPIISLALASTFGIYGLLRKKLSVDAFVGLLTESLILLPIAVAYWLLNVDSATSNMMLNSSSLNITLLAAGVVTTAPLLCFTAAAKHLTLSTLGFFQYIGPSIMFILAIGYYGESLQLGKLATFACIWLALIIYSVDSVKTHRRQRRMKTVQ